MADIKRNTERDADTNNRSGSGIVTQSKIGQGNTTQSAADSFESDTRDQLNLLREKTFNPLLRELVGRVRDNEPVDIQTVPEGDIDSLSPDELQLALARLYYRAKMIRDNGEINISFDPFAMRESSPAADLNESLDAYLTDRMADLSCPSFAILSYDVEKRGYVPTLHALERYDPDSVIISLRDNLFKSILSTADGVILDPSTIRDDPFLAKIFALNGEEDGPPIYFIQLGSLAAEIISELSSEKGEAIKPFMPQDILMIELTGFAPPFDPAKITDTIRRKLSLPFCLRRRDNIRHSISLDRYDDANRLYELLHYMFAVFLNHTGTVGIRVHAPARGDADIPFLSKYMLSDLRRKLNADSAVLHIVKNRLIILTNRETRDEITRRVMEYNRLFGEPFTVTEFYPENFADSIDVIQKIILDG